MMMMIAVVVVVDKVGMDGEEGSIDGSEDAECYGEKT